MRAELARGAAKVAYDPGSIRSAEDLECRDLQGRAAGRLRAGRQQERQGNYTGVHNIGLPLRDGKVISGTLDHPICNRADVPWQKFPELEQLGRK